MKIAHLTWLLSRRGGGIPPVVFAAAGAQRALGHDARITGVEDPGFPVEGATTFRARGPLALGFAPGMAGHLAVERADVLHLHGLFTWTSAVARGYGRRSRQPVVVSPHGMLEPWALANSAWKKRLFRLLVEDENLRRAACLHALCEPEAAQFRRLGLANPIAIVPNGVDLPDPSVTARAFLDRYPGARGRPFLLFLGRIHPKKGLPNLVDAWASVRRERPAFREWKLVVAGPDQLGHSTEVARRAADAGIAEAVELTGPLLGEIKQSALAAATGFVLPSFSEGFSIAVLEAMAARLPVLVTRQCNIDVEAIGAGLVGEPDARSVARQLTRFVDLADGDRRRMGARGRAEVESRYTWPRIARDLLDAYGFVLGDNARPAFVEAAS